MQSLVTEVYISLRTRNMVLDPGTLTQIPKEPLLVCTIANSGFFKNFLYQGGVKSTVSWVLEDLKFKISDGYDQNWCFPDSAQLAVSAKQGRVRKTPILVVSVLKF